MKTKFSLISILLMGMTSLCGFSQTRTFSMNHPYISPTPGEITIMASTPIPNGVKSSHKSYQELVDCGFNLGNEKYSIKGYEEEFDLIGDLNFKYLIYTVDFLSNKMKPWIETFKDNKYVGGWNFKDEPLYKDLPEYQKYYNELYTLDSSKLVLLNLVGAIWGDHTGPYKTYLEYLDYIDKMFNPPVWCFDLYPISVKNGQVNVSYDNFFNALESMSSISQTSQRPFWSYVQSMGYISGSTTRPAATRPYLSFAAFSALAYGAQGIAYWTYGQRQSNSSETYTSALVDLNGKKTKAWYDAKNVNSLIKKYNHVFFESKVLEVKHTGSQTYKGTTKLEGSFGPFSSITTGSAGVLVSRIESKAGKFIVVVNHDVTSTQKITLKVGNDSKVAVVTATKSPQYGPNFQLPIKLDKGGIAIFQEI